MTFLRTGELARLFLIGAALWKPAVWAGCAVSGVSLQQGAILREQPSSGPVLCLGVTVCICPPGQLSRLLWYPYFWDVSCARRICCACRMSQLGKVCHADAFSSALPDKGCRLMTAWRALLVTGAACRLPITSAGPVTPGPDSVVDGWQGLCLHAWQQAVVRHHPLQQTFCLQCTA